MVMVLKPAVELQAPPRAVFSSKVRKIGICGSYVESLKDAPWEDPSWELWGHASSRGWYGREMDRYFDLHSKSRWARGGRKGHDYPKWLARNTVPIYMQERFPEVPASIKYPKERILQEFRSYVTSQVGWMMALALTEGVTHFGFFGINFSLQSEYESQRGGCEYWMGVAEGRGVKLVIPKGCTLLREPASLYGYDSHDEVGVLKEEYQGRKPKAVDTIRPVAPGEVVARQEPPPYIRQEIEEEERIYPRPAWSLGPTNGELKEGA